MKQRLKIVAEALVGTLPLYGMLIPFALALVINQYNGMPGSISGLGMMASRAPVTVEWVSPDGKQIVFGNSNGGRKLIELSDYDLKQIVSDDRPVVGRKYEVVTFPMTKYGQGLRLRRV